MSAKNKKILFWGLFLSIFVILLIVATLFDYQISEILASKGLKNGQYFSSNEFGRIFEVIGEMPLYLFIMFACAIVFDNFQKGQNKHKKIFEILFFIIGGFASFYGLYKFGKYLAELNPTTCKFLHESVIINLAYAVLGMILQAAMVVIYINYFSKYSKELLPFAMIVLFAAVCSQVFVQGCKPFFARERFRAIYYLDYRKVDSQGFTNWYIANGSSSKIAATFDESLNVTSAFFSSFPSGHTCAAGIVYSIICLPYCFKQLNTRKWKIILIASSIFITGLVGFARIVVGAHYMSDVLFGGTSTFLFVVIGTSLLIKHNKKTN